MPDFPVGLYAPPGAVLTTTGMCGLAGLNDGGFRADIAGNVAAFPAANRVIYCPVMVEVPVTVYQLGWGNGALNGTAEAGIYTEGGTRLVTTTATATSGASSPQFVNIADTALVPGIYYLAMVASTVTTATYARSSINVAYLRMCGVRQEASASLPSTATFATAASSYMPFICASLNATI
jgi:hypothetical protein